MIVRLVCGSAASCCRLAWPSDGVPQNWACRSRQQQHLLLAVYEIVRISRVRIAAVLRPGLLGKAKGSHLGAGALQQDAVHVTRRIPFLVLPPQQPDLQAAMICKSIVNPSKLLWICNTRPLQLADLLGKNLFSGIAHHVQVERIQRFRPARRSARKSQCRCLRTLERYHCRCGISSPVECGHCNTIRYAGKHLQARRQSVMHAPTEQHLTGLQADTAS